MLSLSLWSMARSHVSRRRRGPQFGVLISAELGPLTSAGVFSEYILTRGAAQYSMFGDLGLRFNRLASISACSRVRYTTGAPSKPFNGSAVPRVDEAWRTITTNCAAAQRGVCVSNRRHR